MKWKRVDVEMESIHQIYFYGIINTREIRKR